MKAEFTFYFHAITKNVSEWIAPYSNMRMRFAGIFLRGTSDGFEGCIDGVRG